MNAGLRAAREAAEERLAVMIMMLKWLIHHDFRSDNAIYCMAGTKTLTKTLNIQAGRQWVFRSTRAYPTSCAGGTGSRCPVSCTIVHLQSELPGRRVAKELQQRPPVRTEAFTDLISAVTTRLAGKPLDGSLQDDLNEALPPSSTIYQEIFLACRAGIDAGWMCSREAGGIKFGRVIKAGPQTHGFSVDVVDMNDVVGPYHSHPNGEIDLVMPLTPGARFDGHDAGWCVYEAGSAHYPTVTGGRALVLYLLPEGKIEFNRS